MARISAAPGGQVVDVERLSIANGQVTCAENSGDDGVLAQDEASRLQRVGMVDEGAEHLALVGQVAHPLIDVVARFDRKGSRAVADAPLARALPEHPLANPNHATPIRIPRKAWPIFAKGKDAPDRA